MKAIGVLVHGGPEALEIINVPEVNVGPGEIRIKNQASGVNPTDVGVRDGRKAELQKKYSPPYVPGMDLSGVVDQVGGDVITGIKVGDKVSEGTTILLLDSKKRDTPNTDRLRPTMVTHIAFL